MQRGKKMGIHDFVSKVQEKIVFDPRFTGIKARYSRRVEDKEGDRTEDKSVLLFVSPQGNFGVADKRREEFDARLTVIWAKTKDLKFDGEPFLPKEGDMIEYKKNGVLYQYRVTVLKDVRTQSSMGTQAAFSYEDGLQRIIKIMTVKEK
jgi:hypothetical protein